MNPMRTSSQTNLEHLASFEGDNFSAVQSIFSGVTCYQLLANSNKAVVFETSIPFQLAFFALVEHDTDVAPLWDPAKRQFVGLMTISDYVQALQVCRRQGISMLDLSTRSITDMLSSPAMRFRHPDYQTLDAEDTIQQLCLHLHRHEADYVPIIDPDEGNLVSILGYLDVVHLLDQAAKQHPHLFAETIEQMRIGQFTDVLTAPRSALLCEVLTTLHERNFAAMPIVDETSKVVGLFHRSDVTFVTKSPDPDSVLTNLAELYVGDAIALQQQQLQSGEALTTTPHVLVTCSLKDRLSVVLNAMMLVRSTIVVCVDERGTCLGIIAIKDIVKYYFERGSRSSR